MANPSLYAWVCCGWRRVKFDKQGAEASVGGKRREKRLKTLWFVGTVKS